MMFLTKNKKIIASIFALAVLFFAFGNLAHAETQLKENWNFNIETSTPTGLNGAIINLRDYNSMSFTTDNPFALQYDYSFEYNYNYTKGWHGVNLNIDNPASGFSVSLWEKGVSAGENEVRYKITLSDNLAEKIASFYVGSPNLYSYYIPEIQSEMAGFSEYSPANYGSGYIPQHTDWHLWTFVFDTDEVRWYYDLGLKWVGKITYPGDWKKVGQIYSNQENFPNKIDDLSFWGKALTDDDISAIYHFRGSVGNPIFHLPQEPSATTTPTTAWDIYLSNVNCCGGLACNIPITFTRYVNGYDLKVSLDADACNVFATGTVYTLNYWAQTPEYVQFPAAANGSHTGCMILSQNGNPESTVMQTINYYATTSPYCVSPDIATSTFPFCNPPCSASSTTSLWEGFLCGLKTFGCWLVMPSEKATRYITGGADLIKTKFPANLYFGLTDAFTSGLEQTSDSRAGTLGMPFIRQTATGSEFYILPVLDASSTEKTIGKANSTLFRNTQIWAIWIGTALLIVFILTKGIKK